MKLTSNMRYVLGNGLFAICLYAGLVKGSTVGLVIGLAIAWLAGLVAVLLVLGFQLANHSNERTARTRTSLEDRFRCVLRHCYYWLPDYGRLLCYGVRVCNTDIRLA